MATSAQITANRANAQLSTGPRSVEGKAISSRNSFKLGITAQSMIIPGEDPAELDQLTAEYEQQFQPVGVIETGLVQTAVRAQWMQQRYSRIEAAVIHSRVAALKDTEHALGAAVIQDSESDNTLQKIFRRQQAAQRDWYRALETLERLQAHRRRAEMQSQAVVRQAQSPVPGPPRVRFDGAPQPVRRPAPEPSENLALRL
jgi:hypothetical protein